MPADRRVKSSCRSLRKEGQCPFPTQFTGIYTQAWLIKVNIDLISFLWVTGLSLDGITIEMVYFLFDGTK